MNVKEKLGIAYIRFKFKWLAHTNTQKAAEKAYTLFCTPMGGGKMVAPAIFNIAESASFKHQDYRIKGYRWNQIKQKKYLVIHGFGSRAYKFHQYIADLVKNGCQVLAFDAPAHGHSKGKTLNVLEYAATLEAIIEKHGPFDGILAHSIGGLAISLVLEKQPEPLKQCKVVLIAPASETTTAITQAFELLQLKNPTVIQKFYQYIQLKSGHPAAWFSVNRAIGNFQNPVLWIHDEHDPVTPIADTLVTQQKQWPHVQFMITQNLGHRKIYHSTSVKNAAIQFLTTA